MNESRYQLVYIQVRYNQKSKKLEVVKLDSYYMDTYAQAAAVAYSKHGLAWRITFRKSVIFSSNPAWSYSNIYSFAVVVKRELPRLTKIFYSYGFSFDLTERRGHFKRNIIDLVEFLSSNSKNLEDISLNACKWHKLLSIPEGYLVLQPGEIIKESDNVWYSCDRTGGYFGQPRHYDINKTIEIPKNMGYIKNGVTYKIYRGLPSPLVIRKEAK